MTRPCIRLYEVMFLTDSPMRPLEPRRFRLSPEQHYWVHCAFTSTDPVGLLSLLQTVRRPTSILSSCAVPLMTQKHGKRQYYPRKDRVEDQEKGSHRVR